MNVNDAPVVNKAPHSKSSSSDSSSDVDLRGKTQNTLHSRGKYFDVLVFC